jgi:hypothetical protein
MGVNSSLAYIYVGINNSENSKLGNPGKFLKSWNLFPAVLIILEHYLDF